MTTPVVLITGALTGIGRATGLAFAQEGARIVVSGRRDQAGHALTQELRSLGVEAGSQPDRQNRGTVRPARCRRQQCGHRR